LAEQLAEHMHGPPAQAAANAQAHVAMLLVAMVMARALRPARARQWLTACRIHPRRIASLDEVQV
jgi:hypothetical protein